MQCEICGKEAGRGRQINLDGSALIVCDACTCFGTEKQRTAIESAQSFSLPGQRPLRPVGKPFYEKEQLDLGLDIEPDYGKLIRKAREQKNLTVKELAMKVFEKESVLHRIESQAIKPSDALLAKLEKQLGIKLKTRTT